MSRLNVIAVLLVVSAVASACTSGSEETSTTAAPTTTVAPVTTLATTTTSSTTTLPQATTTTTVPVPTNDCVVTPNTSVEGYTQGCTVLDIEILAGDDVDPDASRRCQTASTTC